jgi:hypothetical protein
MTGKIENQGEGMPSPPFVLGVDPSVIYAPVGRCIYCDGETSELGDEHIIPYSLNGTHILPEASCRTCEAVTSYLDGFLSRDVFYQLRVSGQMRTRGELPKKFPVIFGYADGRKEKEMVSADIHPATLTIPKFRMPDLLSGRPPDGNFYLTHKTWMRESAAFDALKAAKGVTTAEVETWVKPVPFSRALAKIAHSYAVARLGVYGFKPLLRDLIHGRNVGRGPELVGSEPEVPPPATDNIHELELDLLQYPKFVVVRMRLFAGFSIAGEHAMPVHVVVAGESS